MLTDRRPILLANARVVDPSRDFDGPADVLIADGVIRDSRRGIGAAGVPEGTDIINCSGKVVAPGLVDMRAFVGEPGASHRETFASASQAAAAGGITTIICQPDTSPVIDNSATVDFVLRRSRDTAIVNIHPMAALTKGLRGEEMTEIGLLKAAGAVAFTDCDKSVTNAQVMRRADFKEEAIGWGQFLAQEIDRRRWQLGHLASAVMTRYGDDSHNSFAKSIGVRAKTLYEYRRVYAFYENKFCDAENLNWTHYREAVRLRTPACALWALGKAADRGWTAEKFALLLSRYLGTAAAAPAVFEGTARAMNSPLGVALLLGRETRVQVGRAYSVTVKAVAT